MYNVTAFSSPKNIGIKKFSMSKYESKYAKTNNLWVFTESVILYILVYNGCNESLAIIWYQLKQFIIREFKRF